LPERRVKSPFPQRIGRYEVLDRLGEGGMGLLYLARDPVLDRTVAIKVLTVFNDEIKQRFAGEARSAARLTHPKIITIYDVGEEQSQPFIAMEYIDGETLSEVIRRRAPLRLIRRLELILQLCSGLGHAHKMGIVHRDIKPANLMLTADGVLKILDFGLARIVADAATSGLTRAGAMLGTPHYMSPEQAMGHPADHRSDIFAVGLVMYELLTWQKAFSGDSPHVVMHKIAHESPRPIRQLFPMIEPQLEEIVTTALDRDPDRRFQSLSAFAAACVRAKDDIVALADSTTVRVERPAPPKAPADSHTPSSSSKSADSGSSPERKTPVGGVRLPSREALARRRAEQIDRYITEARNHLQTGRYEAAIEQCELALILDTAEARALATLHAAHAALEDQQIQHWLADARSALSRGSLSAAEHLVAQSLQVRPEAGDAQALQQEIAARRDEQRSAHERARMVAAALERARQRFENGQFDSAVKAAGEALDQDPEQQEALDLKARAAAALEERQRQQEAERRAQLAVSDAQQRARRGDHAGAIAVLRGFDPPVAIVRDALAAIEAEERQLERQNREEAERQRRAQEEADRQRRAHEALVRQRQAQDAERQQRLRDEAKRRHEPAEDDSTDPTVVQPAVHPESIRPREAQRDPNVPRRLEGEVRRRAAAVAMQARRQFVAGDHQAALATLHAFSPQELVAPVIAELETELRRLKRRREETAVRARGTIDAPRPSPSGPDHQLTAPHGERPAPVHRPQVEPAPAPRPHPAPIKMPVPDTPAASLQVIPLTWTNGAIALVVLVLFIIVIAYSCG
jgi:serine/threonine protein kinase